MRNIRTLLAASAMIAGMTVGSARAATPGVIVGNSEANRTGVSGGPGIFIFSHGTDHGYFGSAVRFTMGENDYALSSADLGLRFDGDYGERAKPLLQLYAGGSFEPDGPSLVSFLAPAKLTNGRYSFGVDTAYTLRARSSYFLFLSDASANRSGFYWNGAGGTAIENGAVLTGNFYSNSPQPQFVGLGMRPNFAVNGTAIPAAVPEPATWAMMLIGFGLIGGAGRYRRRKVTTTVAFA